MDIEDKRIGTVSGDIFEGIVVWYLYYKYKIHSQRIDIMGFDVIAFDTEGELNSLFKTGVNSKGDSQKIVLISVKSRRGHLHGIEFEKAEEALEYGRQLGIAKMLYAMCFFDKKQSKDFKNFEINLFPIESAIEVAKKSPKQGHSIRFNEIIKYLQKNAPSNILRLD